MSSSLGSPSYIIKICGNKYSQESQKVAHYQPDIMGWIFSPKSPRCVPFAKAMSQISDINKMYPKIKHMAVFAQNTMTEIVKISERGLFDYFQIIEKANFFSQLWQKISTKQKVKIIPSLRVSKPISSQFLKNGYVHIDCKPPFFVLDSFVLKQLGGTGKRLNPNWILSVRDPFLLGGGLNPENVKQALKDCWAWGVDVSSGLEDERPGYKNEKKIASFVKTVRSIKPHFEINQPLLG